MSDEIEEGELNSDVEDLELNDDISTALKKSNDELEADVTSKDTNPYEEEDVSDSNRFCFNFFIEYLYA